MRGLAATLLSTLLLYLIHHCTIGSYFIVYLYKKDVTDQTGFESYVFDKLNDVDGSGEVHHKLAPDVSWLPTNEAMAIPDTKAASNEVTTWRSEMPPCRLPACKHMLYACMLAACKDVHAYAGCLQGRTCLCWLPARTYMPILAACKDVCRMHTYSSCRRWQHVREARSGLQ